jgi:hypothetical protein
MVNYKIVNDMQLIDIGAGYVERGGDIIETKTNQIIKRGLSMRKAKDLVRHLNFGGGFDGSTPAFFLAWDEKIFDSNKKRV